MRPFRVALALCCGGCLLPLASRAAAQGAPYNKSDLIRLLGSLTVTRQEIAAQVGYRCVSFTPTARDLLDLRTAGADSAILHNVANCAEPGAPIRLVLPAVISAAAGGQVTIEARLVRGAVPQPGIRLLLRGTRALPGGLGVDPGAVTDPGGVARFRLGVGTRIGTYPLEVVAATGTPRVQAFVDLTVTPAPATRAEVTPADLVFVQGGRAPISVRVEVRDAHGNAVTGAVVELRGLGGAPIPGIPAALSDARGVATFEVPPGAVAVGGRLGVVSAGRQLATLGVRHRSLVLSAEGTGFAGGMDQRGVVGAELPRPLVFAVRDQLGGPVAGYAVEFTGSNATVVPATGVSDAKGEVAVKVTLGERAGPAVVTGRVGDFTREAALYAVPGEPRELVVQQRGGVRVEGTLAITTRDPVPLRVAARDAFGNPVLTGDVRVSVAGDVVRVATGSQYGPPGTVVLEAQRSGRAVVTLRAAGLEAQVPVEVTVLGVGGWVWGVRAGGAAFSYEFSGSPSVGGRGGFRGELVGGRQLPSGLRLELGLGVGSLSATTGSRDVTVMLWQGSLRAEYALIREGRVVPVVALGGGGYRLKSTDPAPVIYHTSVFWSGGVGADVTLGPAVVGEVRVTAQRLMEATSTHALGPVGWLTVFEVGARFTP